MILARHAEALYWVGRYLERAETTARCLDVADASIMHLRVAEAETEWFQLVRALGLQDEFTAADGRPTQGSVARFLLGAHASPGSVRASVAAVRDNLRVARDRVPIELWEEANRLFLLLRDIDVGALGGEVHDTLVTVRRGCQAMSGVVGEAMVRDEGHGFIVIGRMSERAILTVDLLSAALGSGRVFDADRLLRSASALQAFRRRHGYDTDWVTVADFLILDSDTPRSVLSCLRRIEDRLARFDRAGTLRRPRRLAGRLRSEVEFGDLAEALEADPFAHLAQLAAGIIEVAASVQAHVVPPIATPEMHSQFVRPGRRAP
jgi:uncharacterized alpha-E superfamily protein